MTPTAAAVFLSRHVGWIALREDAGDCLREIRGLVESIERAVNRPRPKRYAGPCPTINEDREECRVALYAEKFDSIEVMCWRCKTTHNVERLIEKRLTEVPNQVFNWRDTLNAMAILGEHIPQSTWRRWRAENKVPVSGELYGEPAYKLEDVRDVRRKYTRRSAS